MTIARAFADFASSMDPPPEATDAAKRCLLDWAGAAISGSMEMPATAFAELTTSTGNARLWPSGRLVSPRDAALINGTASHIVEVDDIFSPGLYHPGVVTIPAALALCEAERGSGKRLLRAIIAGYEIGNRIARTVNPAHYQHWHTTATVGHFGAAIAGSVALDLPPERTAHAIGLAATFAAGLRHAFAADGMAKPLHAGRAAEAGVLAAQLAAAGTTAVSDMLEGERGFGAALSEGCNWNDALSDLGQHWTITRTTQKAYACCGHNFAALDGIGEIMADLDMSYQDIAAIEIAGYRATVEICGNPDPVSAPEARFSLPYCAAIMATHGSVAPTHFSAPSLADQKIRVLSKLVSVKVDDQAEAAFPELRGARVTIIDQRNRRATTYRRTRSGDPDYPMTNAEIANKYSTLSCPVIGKKLAGDLESSLTGIEKARDIRVAVSDLFS